MIKAVFFDIDGTIVSMITHEMPASTKEALYSLKEKGIKLFISSGRPPMHIQLLCKDLQEFPWDGMVLLNGQYCTDENGQVFFDLPLPEEGLKELVPWLKESADFSCVFYELEHSYDIRFNQSMFDYLNAIGRLDQMPQTEDPVRSYTHKTYQICPYIPPEADEEFLKHAPGMASARWTPNFADIIPAGGGKKEGLRHMLERHGLSRSECMSFGDGGNDISMLDYAQIGVAMGNADDEVKSHADYVTDTCENDGIFKAFKHFEMI